MSAIDHNCTRELVCPYCGYKYRDSYKYFSIGAECTEVDCDCGQTFEACRTFDDTYDTAKREVKK